MGQLNGCTHQCRHLSSSGYTLSDFRPSQSYRVCHFHLSGNRLHPPKAGLRSSKNDSQLHVFELQLIETRSQLTTTEIHNQTGARRRPGLLAVITSLVCPQKQSACSHRSRVAVVIRETNDHKSLESDCGRPNALAAESIAAVKGRSSNWSRGNRSFATPARFRGTPASAGETSTYLHRPSHSARRSSGRRCQSSTVQCYPLRAE
jgi:hypothetical protein